MLPVIVRVCLQLFSAVLVGGGFAAFFSAIDSNSNTIIFAPLAIILMLGGICLSGVRTFRYSSESLNQKQKEILHTIAVSVYVPSIVLATVCTFFILLLAPALIAFGIVDGNWTLNLDPQKRWMLVWPLMTWVFACVIAWQDLTTVRIYSVIEDKHSLN